MRACDRSAFRLRHATFTETDGGNATCWPGGVRTEVRTPRNVCLMVVGGLADAERVGTGKTMASFAVLVESSTPESRLEPTTIVGIFRTPEEAANFRALALRVLALQNCTLAVVAFPGLDQTIASEKTA